MSTDVKEEPNSISTVEKTENHITETEPKNDPPEQSEQIVNPPECSIAVDIKDVKPEPCNGDGVEIRVTGVENEGDTGGVENKVDTIKSSGDETKEETKPETRNEDIAREGVENAEDIKSEDEEEGSLLLDDFLDSLDVLDSWNPDEDELEGIGDDQTQTEKDGKSKEEKPEKKEREKRSSRRDSDRRSRPGGSRRRSRRQLNAAGMKQ